MAMYDFNYYEQMKLAEQGDPEAMFNVASYTVWGDQSLPIEPEAAELAVRYYKKNAENGDADSMLDLGAMYLEGRGVPKDEKEALMRIITDMMSSMTGRLSRQQIRSDFRMRWTGTGSGQSAGKRTAYMNWEITTAKAFSSLRTRRRHLNFMSGPWRSARNWNTRGIL